MNNYIVQNDAQNKIKDQFNALADDYDDIKKRNSYYFSGLKKVFKEKIIGRDLSIIEIGCGTGEILKILNPKVGAGVDISSRMVEIARLKNPGYSFYCNSLENLNIGQKFDYVLLPDVLEYVEDLEGAMSNLKKLCHGSTKIIITSPNPFWGFVLKTAEILNLKMKDSLSKKHSKRKIVAAAEKLGFETLECSTRLLAPKKILFADYINDKFFKIPILNKFGVIQVFVLKLRR